MKYLIYQYRYQQQMMRPQIVNQAMLPMTNQQQMQYQQIQRGMYPTMLPGMNPMQNIANLQQMQNSQNQHQTINNGVI